MTKSGVTEEKEFSSDENGEKKTKIEELIDGIRSNFLPLILSLLIGVITIIVVPIIYSEKRNSTSDSIANLGWNSSGLTIINETCQIQGENVRLGVICSLAIDQLNHLYLLDQSNNRIFQFNLQTNETSLIVGHLNGSSSSDLFSLNSPHEILHDQNSNLYIVDTNNHRIQRLFTNNNTIETILGTGQMGSNLNELNTPMSITIDQHSNILYIADCGNNRIIQLTFNGVFTPTILINSNGNGATNSFITSPISIRYDSLSTSLFIAQNNTFNVVRWPIGSSSWIFVAGSVNSDLSGTSRTLFNEICSISLDIYGNLYVVDCLNERIQFFANNTVKGKTIAGVIQQSGTNPFLFSKPTSMIFDSNLNIYVSDSLNHRIQFFQRI